MEALLRERAPLYEPAADMTVDTTGLATTRWRSRSRILLRTPVEIKSELVRRALAAGFDDCRVARAEEPAHAEEFREWLAEGSAGEMAWMARGAEKRCDPQKVLPGARSVMVLAMNYWQGERGECDGRQKEEG